MAKIKNDQQGFGVIEGLLVIIAVTLIVFVGFYIKDNGNKNDSSAKTASLTSSNQTTTKPKTTTTPKSDTDLIIAAVKNYKGQDGSQDQSGDSVTVNNIVGDNAQGSFNNGTEGGGAAFIAHKQDGSWQVVYEGQQAAGPDIGAKYNLPGDWYASN